MGCFLGFLAKDKVKYALGVDALQHIPAHPGILHSYIEFDEILLQVKNLLFLVLFAMPSCFQKSSISLEEA